MKTTVPGSAAREGSPGWLCWTSKRSFEWAKDSRKTRKDQGQKEPNLNAPAASLKSYRSRAIAQELYG